MMRYLKYLIQNPLFQLIRYLLNAHFGKKQLYCMLNTTAKHTRPPKDRMFRHYYDIVMLDSQGFTTQALDDPQLLDLVLINKKTCFSSPSANYETANIGTMHLMPNMEFIETLRKDCDSMSEMFFGETPNFDNIITEVDSIEKKINSR